MVDRLICWLFGHKLRGGCKLNKRAGRRLARMGGVFPIWGKPWLDAGNYRAVLCTRCLHFVIEEIADCDIMVYEVCDETVGNPSERARPCDLV
jgi:hypothetical protein